MRNRQSAILLHCRCFITAGKRERDDPLSEHET